MRIDLDRLRAMGVEFDFDKRSNSVTFQRDKWHGPEVDSFNAFIDQLHLHPQDVDDICLFIDKVIVMRALRDSSL